MLCPLQKMGLELKFKSTHGCSDQIMCMYSSLSLSTGSQGLGTHSTCVCTGLSYVHRFSGSGDTQYMCMYRVILCPQVLRVWGHTVHVYTGLSYVHRFSGSGDIQYMCIQGYLMSTGSQGLGTYSTCVYRAILCPQVLRVWGHTVHVYVQGYLMSTSSRGLGTYSTCVYRAILCPQVLRVWGHTVHVYTGLSYVHRFSGSGDIQYMCMYRAILCPQVLGVWGHTVHVYVQGYLMSTGSQGLGTHSTCVCTGLSYVHRFSGSGDIQYMCIQGYLMSTGSQGLGTYSTCVYRAILCPQVLRVWGHTVHVYTGLSYVHRFSGSGDIQYMCIQGYLMSTGSQGLGTYSTCVYRAILCPQVLRVWGHTVHVYVQGYLMSTSSRGLGTYSTCVYRAILCPQVLRVWGHTVHVYVQGYLMSTSSRGLGTYSTCVCTGLSYVHRFSGSGDIQYMCMYRAILCPQVLGVWGHTVHVYVQGYLMSTGSQGLGTYSTCVCTGLSYVHKFSGSGDIQYMCMYRAILCPQVLRVWGHTVHVYVQGYLMSTSSRGLGTYSTCVCTGLSYVHRFSGPGDIQYMHVYVQGYIVIRLSI